MYVFIYIVDKLEIRSEDLNRIKNRWGLKRKAQATVPFICSQSRIDKCLNAAGVCYTNFQFVQISALKHSSVCLVTIIHYKAIDNEP